MSTIIGRCQYYTSAIFLSSAITSAVCDRIPLLLIPSVTLLPASASASSAFVPSSTTTRSKENHRLAVGVKSLQMSTTATRPSSSSHRSSPHKRTKICDLPSSTKKIGTHSGTFQADEALGVWLLRQLPLYRRSTVLRTRDAGTLEGCDVVIDVGGIYDHASLQYDHHQRGYEERFTPKTVNDGDVSTVVERCTMLSASGLVYRHYGREVISEYFPTLRTTSGDSTKKTSSELEWVYNKMYDSFMEAIDAIDTGVEPISPTAAKDGGEKGAVIQLQYRDSTGLSSRVGRVNPRWNELDEATNEPPDPDARFEIASEMCGDDFLSMLTKIVQSDLPARSIVEGAVQSRFKCDPSGEIICLPSGGLPWKSQVYELEKDYQVSVPIKYVLYTDQAGMWRIQCVSVEGAAFENRLGLPAKWRGVRDADLSQVAGIEGCTFCHASGFIGGNRNYDGVLEMARVALEVGKKKD